MSNSSEMSFFTHLSELRWHLTRSFIAIFVGAIIVGIYNNFVVDQLLLGQLNPDFVTYRWLNELGNLFGVENAFKLDIDDFQVQNRQMFGQFNAFIWITIIGGFILAFPYILWEIWRFIKPGLTSSESKSSKGIILATTLLFALGLCFGYYIISPLAIHFGITFQISDKIDNQIDHSSIISTILSSTLASGVMFLFPMVIFFLSKAGIVSPDFLIKYRKHAVVVILIIAGFLTPADMFSQLIAAIPLMMLYEISILVAKVIYKKKNEALVKS